VITFRKLVKRFGDKVVLDGIDLQIQSGEIVFIMGKSGTGKSVLLKNIVGLLRPDQGEIWVEGREVSKLSEAEYFPIRKLCGMVFQFPALLDSLTVFDNLAFGIRAHRLVEGEVAVAAKVKEKLALVHLREEILARYPPELSFGIQKRVAIARTLAVEPRCLLFDEPTTGMDPVGTNAINRLILDLSRRLSVTSVVVSHDMHCALDIADRIVLLDRGHIVEQGSPRDILRSHDPLARQFVKAAEEHRPMEEPT
jgi:phospholipid/cholesterol/gamma-HCH transport system ATP-binding protein